MTNGTELFTLQLPLSLDCDNARIGHAQALFANIRPGDTLYIRECAASGDPDSIISEMFVRAVDVAGPTPSPWSGFTFHINAETADGTAVSLVHAEQLPFDQVIFRPSAQLSEILKASAYYEKHSAAEKNVVVFTKLDADAKEAYAKEVRERRRASAQAAAEQAAARMDFERAEEAHRSPDSPELIQLLRNN